MIFSSPIFIFFFLPLVLTLYWISVKNNLYKYTEIILIIFSLVFYSWWNLSNTSIIIITIILNFLMGKIISKKFLNKESLLIPILIGIIINLLPLFYFKYSYFFLNQIPNLDYEIVKNFKFILPLGISFFTFQQLSYLFDVSRGLKAEKSFLRYSLFVLFFPQLIAGPIVKFEELSNQFKWESHDQKIFKNLSVGLTIFFVGLFKKIVLADSLAEFVNPIYSSLDLGSNISTTNAWIASLSYMFQLYFDFSGYSDMALGISQCFGINLPINFNSPLKSKSITVFWRKWHVTLLRFIGSYLFPLIAVPTTRFFNNKLSNKKIIFSLSTISSTLLIFLVIGFWHGANWTFIIFGLFHGLIVAIESIFTKYKPKFKENFLSDLLGRIWVYFVLIFTWVVFRSSSIEVAYNMIQALLGNTKVTNDLDYFFLVRWLFLIIISFSIVNFSPNIYEIMAQKYRPIIPKNTLALRKLRNQILYWKPNLLWGIISSIMAILSLIFISRGVVEFLYFDF